MLLARKELIIIAWEIQMLFKYDLSLLIRVFNLIQSAEYMQAPFPCLQRRSILGGDGKADLIVCNRHSSFRSQR